MGTNTFAGPDFPFDQYGPQAKFRLETDKPAVNIIITARAVFDLIALITTIHGHHMLAVKGFKAVSRPAQDPWIPGFTIGVRPAVEHGTCQQLKTFNFLTQGHLRYPPPQVTGGGEDAEVDG